MKASKKLITASVALVAALAVSVGSTFAWFTTSNYVSVSGINATVTTTESEVEVRQVWSDGSVKDGKNWASAIARDLTAEKANFELDALTSADGGLTFKDKKGATIAPNGKATLGENEKSKAGYLEVYLQFRTKTANSKDTLLIAAESNISAVDGKREAIVGWQGINETKGYYGTDVAFDKLIEASAADAARLGFSKVTAYASAEKDINTSATTTAIGVWAPNEKMLNGDEYTGAAEQTAVREEATGYWQNNLARDYEKNLFSMGALDTTGLPKDGADFAEGDIDKLYKQPNYTAVVENAEDLTATNVVTFDAAYTLIDGATDSDGYVYGTLCLRFWMEGTDGDCFNNIFSDAVTVTLLLETKKGA